VLRPWFLSALAMWAMSSPAGAACVEPSTLIRSTVSISRYFGGGEQNAALPGIRGTAWFLSPTSMVTAEHVAAAMELSTQDWKQVEVLEGEQKQSIDVRVQRLAGSHTEKAAVIELRAAYSGAQSLQLRMEPLTPDEQVVSLAYPNNRLRFAAGRFVHYGDKDRVAGTALLEMHDGNDRLVLDHGASGAPVLDCAGRVVAVVSNIFTQAMQFQSRAIRVSTAWGNPNVVSVPIQVLKDFFPPN
jgi:hypothetical protein